MNDLPAHPTLAPPDRPHAPPAAPHDADPLGDTGSWYAARWQRTLLLAIPIGALAFALGALLGDPTTPETPIDRWAYPILAVGMLVLEGVLALHHRLLRPVVLAIIAAASGFFLLKLVLLLTADGVTATAIQRELTETFFWVPVVYLLSFILPGVRAARATSVAFTVSVAVASSLFIAPRLAVGDYAAANPLIQLNLANIVFLALTFAFINFRESHTRTRARMEVAERYAFVDSLTGLPNRIYLERHLAKVLPRAERRGRAVGVLFIDVDGFKLVNDTLGHEIGDDLLRAFAERLRGTRRESDFAARISGDEFVVVIDDLDAAEGALIAARRLQAEMVAPLRSDQHEHRLTLSIGVSIYPEHGRDGRDLIRHADSAMYRVKRTGRNGIETYNAEADIATEQLRWIERDLRGAIGSDQLSLVYQPLHDLGSGETIAAEALLRWNHPERGAISPAEFIPIAESSGMILPLGRWVLDEACRQAKAWQRRHSDSPRVLVNVSPLQFAQADFFREVADALERHALPPDLLGIEITESVVVEGAKHATTTIEQLRRLGVEIAVDDFGTGYSSLAYLRDLRVDVIKIDRSFVRDLGGLQNQPQFALALIEAILGIADYLDLRVVAEGVETDAQRELLIRMGCHVGQGYHFARPMPAGEFGARLAARAAVERASAPSTLAN